MKLVNEYSREQFTDEELEVAREVADAVCKVFGISNSDLRGVCRAKPFPDARRIFSHYICNNIKLDKVKGHYNVALPTWYLNQHHSTICYTVQQAENLYETDPEFRSLYDNVVGVLNDPDNYQISVSKKKIEKVNRDKILIWEDVRMAGGYTYEAKKALMPKKISERIKEPIVTGKHPPK